MISIVDGLREMADLFEAQQAPHNLVLHLRTGADEIDRLRAGGCARDQGLTQHCAEAAALIARVEELEGALKDLVRLIDEDQEEDAQPSHRRREMSDIAEKLRERPWRHGRETDVQAKERRQKEREEGAAEIERLTARVAELKAALELFACDCIESGNLCPSPQNCRNYIARAALEERS